MRETTYCIFALGSDNRPAEVLKVRREESYIITLSCPSPPTNKTVEAETKRKERAQNRRDKKTKHQTNKDVTTKYRSPSTHLLSPLCCLLSSLPSLLRTKKILSIHFMFRVKQKNEDFFVWSTKSQRQQKLCLGFRRRCCYLYRLLFPRMPSRIQDRWAQTGCCISLPTLQKEKEETCFEQKARRKGKVDWLHAIT